MAWIRAMGGTKESYLFHNGALDVGGYVYAYRPSTYSTYTGVNGTLSIVNDLLELKQTNAQGATTFFLGPVNVTGKDTIKIDIDSNYGLNTTVFSMASNMEQNFVPVNAVTTSGSLGSTVTIDVSNLTGTYYMAVSMMTTHLDYKWIKVSEISIS